MTTLLRPRAASPAEAQPLTPVEPFAPPLPPPVAARRRRRVRSLLAVVVAPALLAGAWLYGVASDQYVTEFRFSVRQQAPVAAAAPGAGSLLSGGNPMLQMITDSEVVVQYLRSRQVLDDMAGRLDLDRIYARPEADWLARLAPGASMEDRLRHWRRVVDPYFDLTTGIVRVTVRAFTPEDAEQVAAGALALAERLVNDVARRAQDDALAYANAEVAATERRLAASRTAMAEFRNAHAVLFPALQATASAGGEGRLRENLAEQRATLAALLARGVSEAAPQIRALQARIAALEGATREVQQGMAGGEGAAQPLASLMTGYGALEVEERLALAAHERAVGAQQVARDRAAQQSVYLTAFVRPARPEDSMYPIRWRILLQVVLGGLVVWCLGALIVQAVRDRME